MPGKRTKQRWRVASGLTKGHGTVGRTPRCTVGSSGSISGDVDGVVVAHVGGPTGAAVGEADLVVLLTMNKIDGVVACVGGSGGGGGEEEDE